MFRKLLCFVVICGCLTLSGCKLAKDDFGTEHCHFRLVEYTDNERDRLYVHEETGVMYFMNICSNSNSISFTAMIKADGTAYTLEDFEMYKRGNNYD